MEEGGGGREGEEEGGREGISKSSPMQLSALGWDWTTMNVTNSFSSSEHGVKLTEVSKAHHKLRQPWHLEHEDVLEERGKWGIKS